MKRFNAVATLAGITPSELTRVADQLNATGFVTDEDGLCLGSMLIEHWSSGCTSLIRQFGYDGGKLAVRGDFYPSVGAIYVLYDTGFHSGVEAADHLDHVARLQTKLYDYQESTALLPDGADSE